MSKRRLYLHVGTHKTGTTSIQAFVTMNAAALETVGIYVPRLGRPITRFGTFYAGHHNVAWQLNGMPAFDPADGGIAEVLDEIQRAAAPTVVLSSEDFEWLHAKPDVLAKLEGTFAAAGYETTIIVYLRAQHEFVQSVYVEGSKAGFLMNYRRVHDEVIRSGTFVPEPGVVNRFEYGPLLDAFADAFGKERVVVRAYHARRAPDRLLAEFLALIGGEALELNALLKPAALNLSPSMSYVLAGMYAAVVKRDPTAPDPATIARKCFPGDDLLIFDERFDVMTEGEIRRLLERFGPGNLDVERRYGARVPFAQESELPKRSAAAWEAVGKHRRLLDAVLEAWRID